MSYPRFFLSSIASDRLTITGEDARHAARVLRIRPGETITISDGAGAVATARVISVDANLIAEVTDRTTLPPPRPRLTIYQSIPKQGRLDDAADALTQVGVEAIVPVHTHRSVPRWDARKAASHVQRLRTIVREAAMQSRRAWLPKVGDVASLGAIPEGAFVLHEEAPARLRELLPQHAPEHLALAVGPEGGFDPDEIVRLTGRGCHIAGLGPLVLRTELAAVVAATVVLGRYGQIG